MQGKLILQEKQEGITNIICHKKIIKYKENEESD